MISLYRLFSILILVSINVAYANPEVNTHKPPNILLIVVDDLGFTDFGIFGSEIKTPAIDSLAKQGMRFTNFHTSVSCSPTRSMLLTGTDNHLAGLGNMHELLTEKQKGKPGYEGYLNNRVVTIAEVLKQNGYHTYMAGKWHLGSEIGQLPYHRGFEKSFSLLYGGASHWSDMTGLMESETPAKYSLNGKYVIKLPGDFFSTRSYTDYILNAIRSNRNDKKPFFAYLALTAPHDPLHVPEPWLSKYRGQYRDGYEALRNNRINAAKVHKLIPKKAKTSIKNPMLKPWRSLSEKEKILAARKMEVYAGMVENIDYHVNRVVDFLKDIGENDNTVIIILSDNGANPWESDEYPGNQGSKFMEKFNNSLENIGHPGSGEAYGLGWSLASSGPLDYFKMTVAEGGIRTPLIIFGPNIKSPKTVEGFVYVTDIMPTLLNLTSIQHPKKFKNKLVAPMRGRSIVPILQGKAQAIYKPNEYIAGEMGGGRWIWQGDYKATAIAKLYGDGKWKLYNIKNDPGETIDLSQTNPKLLEKLIAAWQRYSTEVGVVN